MAQNDPQWKDELDPRELMAVHHAVVYARGYAAAGAPGHSQFMLIAKLAAMLNKRDGYVETKVDTSLLTPATPTAFDPTRPPDTSKKPAGFT